MKGQRQTLLAIGGAVLLVVGAAAQQPPVTPRPAAPRPNDEGAAPKAPTRLVAPFRGEAELFYTAPVTKQVGTMIVSTMKVQNATNAPLAGLRVDEFWYDAKG